jgi:L-2-hydroxyglutarate oxidase
MSGQYDTVIVGGGIVGLATALALQEQGAGSVAVLEAEPRLAAHQSSHNSGVIHSGLYYRPGSLKAINCVAGRDLMYRFCEEEGVPFVRSGKLVVATSSREIPALDELERRGRANGLQGLKRLGQAELKEIEPEVSGITGLWVREAGLVDFGQVALAIGRKVEAGGGDLRTNFRVTDVTPDGAGVVVSGTGGEVRARVLVNCAGLQSDRIARMCGAEPGIQIVPFRGEYYELVPERAGLVKTAIYPVPDPDLPFLGVHFTRTVDGKVEAGPNAVLAWRREGYRRTDVSVRDLASMATYGGFWRMAAHHWRTAYDEMHRSFSKALFVRDLQKLVPAIRSEDVVPGKRGVRAQAVAPDGKLLDDFYIVQGNRSVHLLNAPSPAATSSLNIGRHLAEKVLASR